MVEYAQKDKYNIDDLIAIVKILRSENGCPWDKVQTHDSIREDFLEETCEAMEAIDLDDPAMMREEFGDVLLQVVFHSGIEKDKGNFDFDDVCDEISRKLIIRHPNVFSNAKIIDKNGRQVIGWDDIKKETKHQKTYTDTLKSVAKTMPGLMRAQKVGKRAAKAGLDYLTVNKCFEDISDKENALKTVSEQDKEKQSEILGNILFSYTMLARKLGIDSELAIEKATDRFTEKFSAVEQKLNKENKDMKDLSLQEINNVYNAME